MSRLEGALVLFAVVTVLSAGQLVAVMGTDQLLQDGESGPFLLSLRGCIPANPTVGGGVTAVDIASVVAASAAVAVFPFRSLAGAVAVALASAMGLLARALHADVGGVDAAAVAGTLVLLPVWLASHRMGGASPFRLRLARLMAALAVGFAFLLRPLTAFTALRGGAMNVEMRDRLRVFWTGWRDVDAELLGAGVVCGLLVLVALLPALRSSPRPDAERDSPGTTLWLVLGLAAVGMLTLGFGLALHRDANAVVERGSRWETEQIVAMRPPQVLGEPFGLAHIQVEVVPTIGTADACQVALGSEATAQDAAWALRACPPGQRRLLVLRAGP
ncbi:MAG: hypothetical protein AB8I08_10980 [Sandaracinaceae bacterium]